MKSDYFKSISVVAIVRTWILAVLWACLGLCLHASYPVLIICSEDEVDYPVHAVKGDRPVVRIDGVDRAISEPIVRIERNSFYQHGFIDVHQSEMWGNISAVNDLGVLAAPSRKDRVAVMGHVQLSFSADRDFENLYVVFVSYPKDFEDKPCEVQEHQIISFDHIGEVEAGRVYDQKLTFAFVPQYQGRTTEYINRLLFFSKGAEVQSSISARNSQYFRSLEECWHNELLRAYLSNNQGASMKHSPVVTYSPNLPEDLLEEVMGKQIIARFRIEADGKVGQVLLEQELSDAVSSAIVDEVRGWLFLPKLSKGSPEASVTRVPLSF